MSTEPVITEAELAEIRAAAEQEVGHGRGDSKLVPADQALRMLDMIEAQPPIPPEACAVEYRLTGINDKDSEASEIWKLDVAWRGGDSWAVMRNGRCLGTDGEFDFERSPSNRGENWKETHRFPLDEAMRLAVEWLPKLKINGMTTADINAKHAAGEEVV